MTLHSEYGTGKAAYSDGISRFFEMDESDGVIIGSSGRKVFTPPDHSLKRLAQHLREHLFY